MSPRTTKLLLGLLLLYPIVAPKAAQQGSKWYQVEMIVFANNHPDPAGERWPQDPGRPELQNAIPLRTGTPPANAPRLPDGSPAFALLGDDAMRLREVEAKLRNSGAYRPLLHLAWRQPIDAKWTTLAISGGRERRVVGTLRLRRKRYLHADLDLLLETPSAGYGPTGYRLEARRRMRSGELHYIDHPMLGVFIEAFPIRSAPAPAKARKEARKMEPN